MVENTGESVQHTESVAKENPQQRFYERFWHWLTDASDAERRANEEARAKLRELSAPELKRIGAKQTVYGVALSSLHWVGYQLGAIGGLAAGGVIGGVGGAIGAAIGSVELGPAAIFGAAAGGVVGTVVGSLAGYQLGVEAAGIVYNKFIRKLDVTLPPLEKVDWLVGQLPPFNPPFIAGVRNLIDGFLGMKQQAAGAQTPAR